MVSLVTDNSFKKELKYVRYTTLMFKVSNNSTAKMVHAKVPLRDRPAGIYLLKFNNEDTKTTPMVSIWLTLNIFYTLF